MDPTCSNMVSLLALTHPFVVGVVVERNVKAASRAASAAFRAGAHSIELNLASISNQTSINGKFFNHLRLPT